MLAVVALTAIVYVPAAVVVVVEIVRVDPRGPLVLVIDTLELENTGVIPAPGGAVA